MVGLTNSGLTKLLISDLVGDVGPHQHAHGDAELLLNHIRDELEAVWSLVHALQERQEGGARLKDHIAQHAWLDHHVIGTTLHKEQKSNLDERYSQCVALDFALHRLAHFGDELVRDDEDQNVCISGCLHQVWHRQLRER